MAGRGCKVAGGGTVVTVPRPAGPGTTVTPGAADGDGTGWTGEKRVSARAARSRSDDGRWLCTGSGWGPAADWAASIRVGGGRSPGCTGRPLLRSAGFSASAGGAAVPGGCRSGCAPTGGAICGNTCGGGTIWACATSSPATISQPKPTRRQQCRASAHLRASTLTEPGTIRRSMVAVRKPGKIGPDAD